MMTGSLQRPNPSAHPSPCSEGANLGLGMMEELKRHGYRASAGTLYPTLKAWNVRATYAAMKYAMGSPCGASTVPRRGDVRHRLRRELGRYLGC